MKNYEPIYSPDAEWVNKDKVKLPIKLKAKKLSYLDLDVPKVNKIKIKYIN